MSEMELQRALKELAVEMQALGFRLVLGGGYGLYLKQVSRSAQGTRTLIDVGGWPLPRSTADLDIFLDAELLTNYEQMKGLRQAIDKLGYMEKENAKYLHFTKPMGIGEVEINLLTGPIANPDLLKKVKINRPRVRPRAGDVKLHAYLTDAAVDLEKEVEKIALDGQGDSSIFLPSPLSFLLMKLHAFDDRKDKEDSDFGRHHALDIYRIIAMLTEQEYEQLLARAKDHSGCPVAERAARIIQNSFSGESQIGILRIKEHSLFQESFDLGKFLSVLKSTNDALTQ